MSDAKVHISAGNELHGAVVETNSYIVNISRQYARIYSYDDYRTGVLAPTAQPTSLTFSNVTSTTMDVSFTASVGGADGYVAFRRTGASPTFVPVDGTTYTVGSTYGDSTCQHFGAGVTFSETGLSANTTYYYDIFAWNGAVGTYAFLTTSPLEGSQLTLFSFRNCLRLDGSNDRVDTTSTTFTNGASTLTVAFWCKADANWTAVQRVIEKINSSAYSAGWGITMYNTNRFQVEVSNATLRYGYYDVGAGTQTTWVHYAFIYDGSQSTDATKLKLYTNATQRSVTYPSAGLPTTLGNSGNAMRIGCQSYGLAQFFDGVIDDIAIWSDAVPQNIIDHYNSGSGAVPNATNLVRHYKMDSVNPSTTVTDETGNDNGTLVNSNFDATSGWETH